VITSSLEHQFRFQKVFWFGLIVFSALLVGYFLASDLWLLAFGLAGVIWLLLLPYHSKLSVILSVATFSSALIVPLFPGRPYMWEFAALLGWSGLVLTISMRQASPYTWGILVKNKWLFIGAIGYCVVLIVTMFYRGVGLRILGSEQMGGRYYFQQLTCVVFPFLFLACPPGERTLVRLFIWQCVLTITFLISDFVFSKAPEGMFFLLQFFELTGDAINFEMRAQRFGIRRFQSFYVVGLGMFLLLLVRYKLNDFIGRRSIWLVPAAAGMLGLGVLSGHRYLALIVTGVVVFVCFAQRFLSAKNVAVAVSLAIGAAVFIYGAADRLPRAAQRAISFLPGIRIESDAKMDAMGTLEVRRTLRRIGIEMAPEYFWIGRGFGLASVDLSWQWDPTTITGHVNQGRFYNGFVGLLVNTGFFGTVFMLLFLGAGLRVCWIVLKMLRKMGSEDDFLRLSGVVAALWLANTIAFLFFHGDSEVAMKTFSLQAGLLLICREHLERRLKEFEGQASS